MSTGAQRDRSGIMKFHLCVLLVVAFVPANFAGDEKRFSLWELIRGNVSHGFEPSPHIINGDEAKPHSIPYMALLYISPQPGVGVMCGGSLIHPEWVLTAAHCVNKVQEVKVLLGVHNRNNNEDTTRQTIKAAQIFVDENFGTKQTDIALLKLEKPATLNEYVQTIQIPARSMQGKNLGGIPGEISGWGGFAIPDAGLSAFLRHAPTTLISNEECKKTFGGGVTDWRVCSHGRNKKGPCGGDSGSPLSITEAGGKKTVVGITAFVAGGCDTNFPAVFTRVDHWLEWINRLTGIPLRP